MCNKTYYAGMCVCICIVASLLHALQSTTTFSRRSRRRNTKNMLNQQCLKQHKTQTNPYLFKLSTGALRMRYPFYLIAGAAWTGPARPGRLSSLVASHCRMNRSLSVHYVVGAIERTCVPMFDMHTLTLANSRTR